VKYKKIFASYLRNYRKNREDNLYALREAAQLGSHGKEIGLKLLFQSAQLEFLASKGLVPEEKRRLISKARDLGNYLQNSKIDQKLVTSPEFKNKVVEVLSVQEAGYRPRMPHGPVFGTWQMSKEEIQKFKKDGYFFIDSFFSRNVAAKLVRLCNENCFWHLLKARNYFGSTLENGLACDLAAAIAEKLEKRLLVLEGDLELATIWTFKMPESGVGINEHADDAKVSVNIWLTPDGANLSPIESAGMLIYDLACPPVWDAKYNTNFTQIRQSLKRLNGSARRIPYKFNRAVVFRSNLYHATDLFKFKNGFENYRTNLTFMFK
jgi:hypothetical protein